MSKKNNVYAVILAGGEGTRFVPLSTPEKPKQFLKVINNKRTMIQQTFDLLVRCVLPENIFVSTNNRYIDLVQKQLSLVSKKNIIGEPQKRNTAPAICLLSYLIHKKDPHAVILFAPSDHFIAESEKALSIFEKVMRISSQEESLFTFGVIPTYPATSYGYIRADSAHSISDATCVDAFVEKPNEQKVQEYLKSKKYFWNSGIFVWRASVFLKAMRQHMPQIGFLLDEIRFNGDGSVERDWLDDFFNRVESISIDYALMEKADNVKVFPFDVGWSDVGTWEGLSQLQKKFQLKLPDSVQEYLVSKIPPS